MKQELADLDLFDNDSVEVYSPDKKRNIVVLVKYKLKDEVRDWLRENNVKYDFFPGKPELRLLTDEDAFAFKMRWQ